MTELEILLSQAGHRPAQHGRRWICSKCPPDKPAAMAVHDEVFFCHRCHQGGNFVTLKKALGLLERRPPKPKEQIISEVFENFVFGECCRLMKFWRGEFLRRFKRTAESAFQLNKIGEYQCKTQGFPDPAILEEAYRLTQEEQFAEYELDWIEEQQPKDFLPLVIMEWEAGYGATLARQC